MFDNGCQEMTLIEKIFVILVISSNRLQILPAEFFSLSQTSLQILYIEEGCVVLGRVFPFPPNFLLKSVHLHLEHTDFV